MLGLELGVDLLTASSNFDIGTFLQNSTSTLRGWFNLALMLLGLVAFVFGIWQIVTGLMSHGKKQVNWAISIILVLVGGALSMAGSLEFVEGIARGGKKTIEDLGNGGTINLVEFGTNFLTMLPF